MVKQCGRTRIKPKAYAQSPMKVKMVNKIKEIALKTWNILNGKDADMDGDVDIDDAMLKAKRKAESEKKNAKEK